MKLFLYRTLSKDFKQDIYIWDVDKTYLNTNFESKRGLLRIAIEASIDKTAIPGVKHLLLELRKGNTTDILLSPIFFVSASPVQLKNILEGKFLIDGIQHDGLILKDYWALRKKVGKFRIKNNFAYKLMALLNLKKELPTLAHEILFGDDYEMDSEVYSIYAAIIEHQISLQKIEIALKHQGLSLREIKRVLNKAEEIQTKFPGVVEKIFIHLIKRNSLEAFQKYDTRLIPTHNYIQTAALLFQLEKISKEGFRRVANSFNLKYPLNGWSFTKSLEDLKHRNLLSPDIFDALIQWK